MVTHWVEQAGGRRGRAEHASHHCRKHAASSRSGCLSQRWEKQALTLGGPQRQGRCSLIHTNSQTIFHADSLQEQQGGQQAHRKPFHLSLCQPLSQLAASGFLA